jgi:hypothetical protein
MGNGGGEEVVWVVRRRGINHKGAKTRRDFRRGATRGGTFFLARGAGGESGILPQLVAKLVGGFTGFRSWGIIAR